MDAFLKIDELPNVEVMTSLLSGLPEQEKRQIGAMIKAYKIGFEDGKAQGGNASERDTA